MGRKRRKTRFEQLELAFMTEGRGEPPTAAVQGTERPAAARGGESPAEGASLMEEVCASDNLKQAYRRVLSNKGAPGVDGMTVGQLGAHLERHIADIKSQLLNGTYKPQPARRVEIPKPDGGTRKLGIPTVVDRFVQQAVMQVLQGRWDGTFSEHSYGFRPKRSAHQAVSAAQQHVAAGLRWVVDIDLEKFFDRVNHDRLMHRVAQRVEDKRLLKLIRAFLSAGVMEDGLVGPTDEGTPQGGPLSPLLGNLVLDELDEELERRGHRFVRYADDCNIYVGSRRAGERVMRSVARFLADKLRLRVNETKSAVARPWERKFLGFSFTSAKEPKRRIAPQALRRMKARVKELTRRSRGVGIGRMVRELAVYLVGWRGHFAFCQTPSVLRDLDSWMRRRLRCVVWKQWKRGRARFAELTKRGVGRGLAAQTAGSPHGPWRISRSPALSLALPDACFDSLGLPKLAAA